MRTLAIFLLGSALAVVPFAMAAGPTPPNVAVVNPTSKFTLPVKPPAPTGQALLLQILLAVVTVGGCAAGGTILVVLDAKYERAQMPGDGLKLKTIRSIEHGFLGLLVLVGGLLFFYAGFQLLKSAGILG